MDFNILSWHNENKVIDLTSGKAYRINGNNYLKLRDIMEAFDIGIIWDGITKTIGIDTMVNYTLV